MILGLSGDAGAGKDTVADVLVSEHGFAKVALADPLKRFLMATFDFSKESLWGPSKLRAIPDTRYPRRHGPWITVSGSTTLGRDVCACCGAPYGSTKPCYLTPRYALQSLGTGWGRACYLDVWVDLCLRDVARLLEGEGWYVSERGVVPWDFGPKGAPLRGVVIPDMRYLNELDKAKQKGARLVRVKRSLAEDGAPRPVSTEPWRSHSSETEQGELPDDFFDAIFENLGPVSDVPRLTRLLLERLRSPR